MWLTMKLFRRPHGVWYVQIRRGKKISLKTRDQGIARSIFRKMERRALETGVLNLDPARRVPLAEFATEYLASREHLSLSTHRMDDLSLRLLADVVGSGTLLRSISRRKIEEFKGVFTARGCKPRSINSYLRHIKAALRTAADWYPGYKPPKIKMMKVEERLPRVLDPAEIDFMLMVAREFNYELWRYMMFYLWTGARRNESLKLR